ncbi:sensor histidine kinase [Desemzia sp. FAM 23989]|uniref:sensor histidine kinase n=1 Tax=Desemzia sp. FAM 23989 TaxID=3259523 RepID=UPI00388A14FF
MSLNKIKLIFQRFSFQKKIVAISFISGIFPIVILTIFSIAIIQHFILSQEKSNNEDNLTSVYQQIDLRLKTYEDALSFLSSSRFLIDGLSIESPSNFEQYDLYMNTLVPLFSSIHSQQDMLSNITLYTTIDLFDHGNYVKKIATDDITTNFKLNNTTKVSYFFDTKSKKIFLYSQIFSNIREDINIVVFEIAPEVIFQNLDTISNDPYALTIQTDKEETLFHFSNQPKQSQLSFIHRLLQPFAQSSSEGTKTFANSWSLTFSRPFYSIYTGVLILIFVAFLIFVFVLLMLTLSIWGLSKTVVLPIQQLTETMKGSPENTLKLKPTYQLDDEIGYLYRSFYQMIQQIQNLIDQVYKSEINQKKHELRALQAQINPHFFYNSLSLISNKAIMIGNEEISEMTQLLSRFYRLSLNNGKNTLSIEKELDLTLTYAKIQLKMHNNSFDLITDVHHDIKEYEIITLLIQPFVENAIFHGIDHIEENRRGILTIRGSLVDDFIQFEITDNGAGMTSDQVSNILKHHSKHYGIQNVQQRISLFYDINNAISYKSELNVGTTVLIKLPKERSINE